MKQYSDKFQVVKSAGKFTKEEIVTHGEKQRKVLTETLDTLQSDAGKRRFVGETLQKYDPTKVSADPVDAASNESANMLKTLTNEKIFSADYQDTKAQEGSINLVTPDNALQEFTAIMPSISLPSSTTRTAMLPFPPSHLIDNYGLHELAHVALEASASFKSDVLNREVVHVTDVQSLSREELGAAFELLRTEEIRVWWEIAASGDLSLYKAIRQRNVRQSA